MCNQFFIRIGLSSAAGRVSIGFAADRCVLLLLYYSILCFCILLLYAYSCYVLYTNIYYSYTMLLSYPIYSLGKLLMIRLCMVMAGILTFCWVAFTSFSLLLLYTLTFGFFSGGFLALLPSVAAELFGIERLGSVIGLLRTCMSVGSFLAGPLAGVLYAIQGNYTIPIIFAGICLLTGAGLVDWMSDTSSLIHLKSADIHIIHTPCQEAHISQKYLEQQPTVLYTPSDSLPTTPTTATPTPLPIKHASLLKSTKQAFASTKTPTAPRSPPPSPLAQTTLTPTTPSFPTSSSPPTDLNLTLDLEDTHARQALNSESSYTDSSYTPHTPSSSRLQPSTSQSLLYRSGKLILSSIESAVGSAVGGAFPPPSPRTRAEDTYALVGGGHTHGDEEEGEEEENRTKS